ncbi:MULTISPECIES: hypothetical protein [unclassified Streptomyces]|uniref:hypothetical protein n=1 Tax=unclassified Streptomyces TaxID=2593676 RepID=UPI000DC38E70|nr:hypothetical protein [Streptomyces sp. PsTaAH-137]RAJ86467.1 hypothetical protein K377_03315 [Streptomyces sp. PsTaAH-137]
MATSRGVLRFLESRKNLTGSACGIAGLALTFAGVAGPYWPVVVAGLYGAGALVAPPERPAPPGFPDPSEQLGEVREDFGRLRDYLAEVDVPPVAAARLTQLDELLTALLDPGWAAELLAQDPEALHALGRAVRQDVPEAVDTYARTRWWTRIAPGQEQPERHLERQLTVVHDELTGIVGTLRETEARRQESHTRYLEERNP